MEHIWISEIADGQLVDGVYFLRNKTLGTTKAGKSYLTLSLGDKTGELEGKVWENAAQFDKQIAPGDFIFLQSRAGLYMKQMQLSVTYLEKVDAAEVEVDQFLPACPRDLNELWKVMAEKVDGLGDKTLSALCRAALDDQEIGPGLRRAPAATGVHQAYLGGLLEHTVSMMLLAEKMCEHYPALDRDLLLAGVLFHDLGKIREMSYQTALDYTDEGKLVGHLIIGARYVERLAADLADADRERVIQLQHMILAHHGRPEFGTVKIPMFAEASVLHYLDNIDAKVFGFLSAEAETTQGRWSGRKWFLETAVYKLERPEPAGYYFALPGQDESPPEKKKKDKGKSEKDMPLFSK